MDLNADSRQVLDAVRSAFPTGVGDEEYPALQIGLSQDMSDSAIGLVSEEFVGRHRLDVESDLARAMSTAPPPSDTIHVRDQGPITRETEALVSRKGDDDIGVDEFRYLLEVDLAKSAIAVLEQWRSREGTVSERFDAVVNYATNDAYLLLSPA